MASTSPLAISLGGEVSGPSAMYRLSRFATGPISGGKESMRFSDRSKALAEAGGFEPPGPEGPAP